MRFIPLFVLLMSFDLFACWRLTGRMSVNRESLIINEKIDHDKSYSFPKGKYLIHIKMPSKFELPDGVKEKKNRYLLEVKIQEKKGTILEEIINTKILGKKEIDANLVSSGGKSITDIQIKVEDI